VGNERILYLVVAMRYREEFVSLMYHFLSIIHVYMCLVYLYVFHLLAHPICLCLAMIMYAVHVSR